MRYKQSFLTEVARFEGCNTATALLCRSNIGLRQFFDYESRGIVPTEPDQYFAFLLNGKKWWEWTLNFMADSYLTFHWDGWLLKAFDFLGDPSGFRQLRARCRCKPCDPEDVIEANLEPGEVYRGLGIYQPRPED